ncbi:MAG: HAMP domain-containing sensor histidine kinase [Verrucomicrobiota bacterium]|nr:HAMP domain-containing sensor histidine kinase [Verrucomicrobiota bacterium]
MPLIPLFSKIIAWFFLNLLLLAVIAIVLLASQFPRGMELLLAGPTGARLQATAEMIARDVRSSPRSEWDAQLSRYSESYGVDFFLFRFDGIQMAGPQITLPAELVTRFRKPGAGAGWLDEMRPPPESPELMREDRFPRNRGVPPRFALRSKNPTQYWVGVPLFMRSPGLPAPPTILLIRSSSLDGNGFFFDWRPLATFSIGAIILSILFWLPLVRGITSALKRMTLATEQIGQGKFNVNLSVERRDELGQLGRGIAFMASRLDTLVNGQRRFLGDIAHELCSPLARIQMSLGILEESSASTPQQKKYLTGLRDEVDQMSTLVNELLAFSKASLQESQCQLIAVNVEAAVAEALKKEGVDSERVVLQIEIGLSVLADAHLLVRALSNLVRNALRYAANSGPIQISACSKAKKVEIIVADSGPGVPEESLNRLFDPFYRVDPSRTLETGGTGLGLTIVKSCIERCEGSVTCRNRVPHGLEVKIQLNQP